MRYETPASVDQAVALLAGADETAKVLAGGTDLLVQLRADMIEPSMIVDIKHIPSMREISLTDGAYRIGAAVPSMQMVEDKALCATWPGLTDAVNLIGSTQIQGRASMGGNLCNGSPAADTVPALIAVGAIAEIAGPDGVRDLAVEDVVLGPRKTALKAGEFVVAFKLPAKPARTGDAYQRFTPRTEMDIAVVGCGVKLTCDETGVITAARVSLGAVAAKPLLVTDAAAAIVGSTLDEPALSALDAAAKAACSPIDDKRGTVTFRTNVAGVLARRTAQDAYARATAS